MSRKSKSPSDAARKPAAKKTRNDVGDTRDDRTPEQRRAEKIRTSGQRETVEAFVVAFVLALLFRAFVAEAFVIPTGSMAPTLMGAHKDLTCQQCGHEFQVGASKERRGPVQNDTVVGGVCPNCRYVNPLDLAGNSNHATFNGDRILVSKFAYTLSQPERWDVIVFKFPGNPKQNYIKRLVGLPNETLTIQYGDVYVRPTGESGQGEILRKPADKVLAMRHHVYDTKEQSQTLIKSDFPSRIQPWRPGATSPPEDSWQIQRGPDGLVATVEAADATQPEWIRYFHHWPDASQWRAAAAGQSLSSVDPYSSRLVTDFYAYDCYVTVPSREVYLRAPSNARMASSTGFEAAYRSGASLDQFGSSLRFGDRGVGDEGLHWVGDLTTECDVELSEDCKELIFEIVEAGVLYQCHLDATDGTAKLMILDGAQELPFQGADGEPIRSVTAQTAVRAGQSHHIRYSNCDDQLLLWIDDDLVTFDTATTFDARSFRSEDENVPHYDPGVHPLDASPFGLAVRGGTATVRRVVIHRDKYYCATNNSSFGIYDYDMNELWALTERNVSFQDIQTVLATPDLWDDFPLWQTRRKVSFELHEDQFFPMGDNSPESLDARCWAGTKRIARLPERFRDQAYAFADASYVPRDLLVGKALVVFWPHPWNEPVPFYPNFSRFRLIR
ncbi:signal peptidase I [Roseiconus nitratireducens]|uniref:Signal peptidase I n=1 Tax=Roseiconus nitratireducens TaxID=2605748 RepID=A0A5M6DF76_9BACT|nr:signal peptidase I [Roseiconus nitratireducens]KAA5546043.1 signal peptidase I [Roseiconus nitratireducens]